MKSQALRALAFFAVALLTRHVAAAQYDYRNGQLFNRGGQLASIQQLDPGDSVRVFNSGSPPETFKLGAYVGKGFNARVYRLQSADTPQSIKFYPPNKSGAMKSELSAFETLSRYSLPAVKPVKSDGQFYIIKPFINGPTLDEMVKGKRLKTPEQSAVAIKQLGEFLLHLENENVFIGDAGSRNIIYDPFAQLWKILDPGTTLPHVARGRVATENLRQLIESNPALGIGFRLSENHSPSVAEYFAIHDFQSARDFLAKGELTAAESWNVVRAQLPQITNPREIVELLKVGKIEIPKYQSSKVLAQLKKLGASADDYNAVIPHLPTESSRQKFRAATNSVGADVGACDFSLIK